MDIVTEPDNKTVCPVRIASIVGIVQFQAMALAHYLHTHDFNAQLYGVGFAALLGAAGIALGLKKDSPKDSGASTIK
jgi:hypothetical protein